MRAITPLSWRLYHVSGHFLKKVVKCSVYSWSSIVYFELNVTMPHIIFNIRENDISVAMRMNATVIVGVVPPLRILLLEECPHDSRTEHISVNRNSAEAGVSSNKVIFTWDIATWWFDIIYWAFQEHYYLSDATWRSAFAIDTGQEWRTCRWIFSQNIISITLRSRQAATHRIHGDINATRYNIGHTWIISSLFWGFIFTHTTRIASFSIGIIPWRKNTAIALGSLLQMRSDIAQAAMAAVQQTEETITIISLRMLKKRL